MVNLTDFSQIAPMQSPIAELLPNIMQGYQMQRLPAQLGLQQQQQELANRLLKAQAQTEESYGGLGKFSGPTKEVLSYHLLRNQLGEDNPIVQDAKVRMEASLAHQQASTQQMQSLVANAPKRYATPIVKRAMENAEAEQGFMPGTTNQVGIPPIKISGDKAQRIKNQNELKTIRDTSDQYTRRGIEQAINIHKSREGINVKDLVAYSGLSGEAQKLLEIGKSQFGAESEKYKRYHESLVHAKTMAKQIRQLLGDSISVEAQDALYELTNPASWKISPEVAERKFNRYMEILDREINTFYQAVQNPNLFYGEASAPQVSPQAQELAATMTKAPETQVSPTEKPGGSTALVRYEDSEGNQYDLPANEAPRLVEKYKLKPV